MIRQKEAFFDKIDLHILECDDRVQKDMVITGPEEIDDYVDAFELSGGYGTDYRPVFLYVDDLRSKGALRELRALLYFTDGYGTYPSRPTDYETAFVFCEGEDYDDTSVPDWAIPVILPKE